MVNGGLTMNIPMQITSKETLVERLETIIRDFCIQESGLVLSNVFQNDLKETTETILSNHNQDGQVLSSIEGTYFFHAIFNTLFPELYVAWCANHRERLQTPSDLQKQEAEFKMTKQKEYVMNTWSFELPERLLVQELKKITQKRFNALQTKSTIELFHSGTYIEIQPASSDVVSKELFNIYMQMEQVEKNYGNLIRRLCPLH